PATWHLITRTEVLTGDSARAAQMRARYRQLRGVAVEDMPLLPRRDVPDLLLTPPVSAKAAKTLHAAQVLFAKGPGQGPAVPPPGAIPKQIFSYWEGERSAPLAQIAQSWARLHPNWTWRSFEAASARDWLNRAGDAQADTVRAAFDAAGSPAQRADILRLALLAREGGLYVDLDDLPRAPVDDMLNGADLVVVQETGLGALANSFLAAAPGHPMIQAALDQALKAPPTEGVETWLLTGPGLLARTWVDLLEMAPDALSSARRVPWTGFCALVSPNLKLPHKYRDDYWRTADG
ncbi:MAG: glycosyltransferase, partial [Pseudomonadota bacterium]